MGYGSYEIVAGPLKGQWGGYNHSGTCGFEGCHNLIDRSVTEMCGRNPHGGDEAGCGLFFCEDHIDYFGEVGSLVIGSLCHQCTEVCDHGPWADDPDRCLFCRGYGRRATTETMLDAYNDLIEALEAKA